MIAYRPIEYDPDLNIWYKWESWYFNGLLWAVLDGEAEGWHEDLPMASKYLATYECMLGEYHPDMYAEREARGFMSWGYGSYAASRTRTYSDTDYFRSYGSKIVGRFGESTPLPFDWKYANKLIATTSWSKNGGYTGASEDRTMYHADGTPEYLDTAFLNATTNLMVMEGYPYGVPQTKTETDETYMGQPLMLGDSYQGDDQEYYITPDTVNVSNPTVYRDSVVHLGRNCGGRVYSHTNSGYRPVLEGDYIFDEVTRELFRKIGGEMTHKGVFASKTWLNDLQPMRHGPDRKRSNPIENVEVQASKRFGILGPRMYQLASKQGDPDVIDKFVPMTVTRIRGEDASVTTVYRIDEASEEEIEALEEYWEDENYDIGYDFVYFKPFGDREP